MLSDIPDGCTMFDVVTNPVPLTQSIIEIGVQIMGDYYSKRKTGGSINSKIEHQDTVALIYALELLSNPFFLGFNREIDDFCIMCENNDDLEILSNHIHIFVQVKSTSINKSSFLKILDNFKNEAAAEEEKESYFVISSFELIKIDGVNFTERFAQYRQVLLNDFETEKRKLEVKRELINDCCLSDYEFLVDRLYIDRRPLQKDDNDIRAIFSKYLRQVYGFKDFYESQTDSLFDILCNKFALLRINRGCIDKKDIESIIGKELCRSSWYSGLSITLGYKKVDNGYIKDNDLLIKRNNILAGVKKGYKKVMSGWRKAFLKEFLLSQLIGAKKCPQCGHPMIANLGGLNGIACPDCGYNPYVSLVLFCECGNYEIIKAQPEVTDDAVFSYLNEYFKKNNHCKCQKCDRELLDGYVELRIALLPIPIPFEKYKDIDKIYEKSIY